MDASSKSQEIGLLHVCILFRITDLKVGQVLAVQNKKEWSMQIPLNWASLWISSSMTNSKLRPSLSGQTSVSFHWLTVSCNVNAYVLEKQIPFWYFLLICNWKKCKGLLKFLVTVMFWLSLIFRFLVAFI